MKKHLIDTNIFIEVLLQRQHAADAMRLLAESPPDTLAMTDFTLHSVGVVLGRLGRISLYQKFLQDTVLNDGITVIPIPPMQLAEVVQTMSAHRLDFDDAYQYTVAEIHDLHIVSFDADFDRTPRRRLTPRQAVELLQARRLPHPLTQLNQPQLVRPHHAPPTPVSCIEFRCILADPDHHALQGSV